MHHGVHFAPPFGDQSLKNVIKMVHKWPPKNGALIVGELFWFSEITRVVGLQELVNQARSALDVPCTFRDRLESSTLIEEGN